MYLHLQGITPLNLAEAGILEISDRKYRLVGIKNYPKKSSNVTSTLMYVSTNWVFMSTNYVLMGREQLFFTSTLNYVST